MNFPPLRFLKSAYRRETIFSFLLIVGVVDALMGGFGERWTLLSFGVSIILVAALVRWWQTQKYRPVLNNERNRYLLPANTSSRPPLPLLTHESRHKKYR